MGRILFLLLLPTGSVLYKADMYVTRNMNTGRPSDRETTCSDLGSRRECSHLPGGANISISSKRVIHDYDHHLLGKNNKEYIVVNLCSIVLH
jgi:hypothetical protein